MRWPNGSEDGFTLAVPRVVMVPGLWVACAVLAGRSVAAIDGGIGAVVGVGAGALDVGVALVAVAVAVSVSGVARRANMKPETATAMIAIAAAATSNGHGERGTGASVITRVVAPI